MFSKLIGIRNIIIIAWFSRGIADTRPKLHLFSSNVVKPLLQNTFIMESPKVCLFLLSLRCCVQTRLKLNSNIHKCMRHVNSNIHANYQISGYSILAATDPVLPPNARGSLDRPRHWIRCLHAIGTTTNIFHDFCHYVCQDIEMNNIPGTDTHRVFIWDNHATHHSTYCQ